MALRLSSDALRQHFTNLPPLPNEFSLREYFPEIKLVTIENLEDQPADYSLVERSLGLVAKLGWQGFVFLVDKLDEDKRFKNNANEIAKFLEPIVCDNKLLLNPDIQLILSIWEVPFKFLTDSMRSQKHFSPRLRWDRGDLEGALNRRLQVFSGERICDYRNLLENNVSKEAVDLLFELANGNPRDLWHIFNQVFRSQYTLNPTTQKICEEAIRVGLRRFVAEFNYYEYYPKPTKNERGLQPLDVYSYIRLLLRVGSAEFTRTQFRDATGVSGGSASNYLWAMQTMGLIANAGREGTRQIYRVVDPKVVFAIEERVDIRNVV